MNTQGKKKTAKGVVRRGKPKPKAVLPPTPLIAAPELLDDVRTLIEAGRLRTARAVNSAMVLTYWSIGERIRREVLGDDRAEYGKQVVERLAAQLTVDYGQGFSRPNLFRMLQFAEAFPVREIVSTLSRQLSWSHVVELLALEDGLRRGFYTQMPPASYPLHRPPASRAAVHGRVHAMAGRFRYLIAVQQHDSRHHGCSGGEAVAASDPCPRAAGTIHTWRSR